MMAGEERLRNKRNGPRATWLKRTIGFYFERLKYSILEYYIIKPLSFIFIILTL